MTNAYKTSASQGYDGAAGTMRGSQHEPAPDLLLQAFNQALRPYNEKVENLENEIHDLKAYIDQLEAQQRDVHTWIDKRGLRPGKSAQWPEQLQAWNRID
jgi:peptidoglycan hydrolase CwlO-like protein